MFITLVTFLGKRILVTWSSHGLANLPVCAKAKTCVSASATLLYYITVICYHLPFVIYWEYSYLLSIYKILPIFMSVYHK